MKREIKAILLAVFFGLLVWVLNAVFDYYFYYQQPFLDLLILNVPPVELYIRLIVLAFFLAFGIIVAWRLAMRGKYERNLLLRQRYLSCLAEISNDLLTTFDLGATLPHVLEHMRAVAGADRCYLFENHRGDSGELLTSQRFEVVAEGIQPQMDNPDLQNLPYIEGGFSRWVEEMTAGRTIVGRVADFPERERAVLQPQDIHWILALPLHVSGELYGFIGLDACRPGVRWGRQEIDLLRAAASSISAAVERSKSDERIRAIFDNVKDGIFVETIDGRILDVNEAACQMLGYTRKELCAMHVGDVIPPEIAGKLPSLVQKETVEKGKYIETFNLRKDGTRFPVEVSNTLVEIGGEGRVIAIIRDITERKRAEEELRAREEKYRALIETTNTGYLIVDGAGRVIDANTEYVRLTGHTSLNEIVERSVIEWTAAHDKDRNAEEVKKCLEKGFVRNLEIDYVDKDGRITPIEINARVVETEEGTRILALCRDITKRKRSEEALRESEARFQQVAENAQEWIWEIDSQGLYTYASPVLEEVLGYKPEEIVGKKHFYDLFHPEDREGLKKAAFEVFVRKQTFREFFNRNVNKDGETVWLSTSGVPILDKAGNLLGYRGADTDITERMRAEEELRAKTERIARQQAAILELSKEAFTGLEDSLRRIAEVDARTLDVERVGIWFFNEDRSRIDCLEEYVKSNDAHRVGESLEMERYPAYFKALEVSRLIVADDALNDPRTCKFSNSYLSPFGITSMMDTAIRLHGRRIGVICHEHVGPQREWRHDEQDFAGSMADMVSLAFEASEMRQAEAQLRHAQKMEAVGTLAGGLAHDFNNILAGIMGYASLAKMGLEKGSPLADDMESIEKLSRRGADLTQALLTFSRKGEYHPGPLLINPIIEEVLNILGRTVGKGINIRADLSPGVSNVMGDEGQLNQVIMNLCLNACEAMMESDTLAISTKDVELDDGFFKIHPGLKEGAYVAMIVSDTGRGMDAGTLERIFEPFFTTRAEMTGTGLGLSIVSGIVESHGGCIEVESQPGRGSTFTVYLPVTSEEVKEIRPKPPGTLRGNETILVVDDEEDFRRSTGKWLKKLGYTAVEAASGERALKVVEERKEEIDLVLLDMVMNGIGGSETFEGIKKIVSALPVIICTGYSLDGDSRQVLEKGANDFIQKPFDLTKLALKVRKVLDNR